MVKLLKESFPNLLQVESEHAQGAFQIFCKWRVNTHQVHQYYVRPAGILRAGLIVQSAIKLFCPLVLHVNNLKLHKT